MTTMAIVNDASVPLDRSLTGLAWGADEYRIFSYDSRRGEPPAGAHLAALAWAASRRAFLGDTRDPARCIILESCARPVVGFWGRWSEVSAQHGVDGCDAFSLYLPHVLPASDAARLGRLVEDAGRRQSRCIPARSLVATVGYSISPRRIRPLLRSLNEMPNGTPSFVERLTSALDAPVDGNIASGPHIGYAWPSIVDDAIAGAWATVDDPHRDWRV